MHPYIDQIPAALQLQQEIHPTAAAAEDDGTSGTCTTVVHPEEDVHPAIEDGEGTLNAILEWLPLPDTVTMRGVCKLWRSVLSRGSFRQRWEQKHRSSTWVVMARRVGVPVPVRQVEGSGGRPTKRRPPDVELVAYDTAARSWMSLSRWWNLLNSTNRAMATEVKEILGGWNQCRNVVRAGVGTAAERLLVAGSADVPGLLCFATYNPHGHSFSVVVLNPLMGHHAVLPFSCRSSSDMERWNYVENVSECYLYLHGGGSGDDGHYCVFICCKPTPYRFHLLTYSSRDQLWRVASPVYPAAKPTGGQAAAQILLEDDNAAGSSSFLFLHEENRCILAYSSERDRWGVCETPEWIGRRGSAGGGSAVFRHRGRLLLAAAMVKATDHDHHFAGESRDCVVDVQGAAAGFCVFEMQRDDGACKVVDWVEIATTPARLRRALSPIQQCRLVYGGGLVWMYMGAASPLVYDIDANSWRLTPPPPPPEVRSGSSTPEDVLALCAIIPSFSATPWPCYTLDD